MTPYPEYKATNLPWLPQIPAHWEIVRAKQIFSPIDIRSEKGEEQLLSVSERYGVVKREHANVTMFQAASYEGYKLCWPDDLAINSLWAWSYGLGFSPYHGIISTAYSVFRLKDKTQCLPRFYDYFVRGKNFHWELRVRSKGLWKSRYQLSDDAFLAAPMLFAPINEQEQIVRYLDSMTAKINKLIRAKKKQIALLQEQKQAIINQAVTKGLNPDAEMKDSGIDWLGQIPAHWEVKKAKYCVNINHGSDPVTEGNVPVYGSGAGSFKTCGEFKEGPAVLVGRKGATLHIPHYITGKYWNVDTAFDVKAKKNFFLHFYYFLATCFDYHFYISQTTLPSMTQTDYLNMKLPVPPQKEQYDIIQYLVMQDEKFDNLITEIKNIINSLFEYKNSLIACVVTGQVDVRNIQVEDFDPADLISETDDDPAEDDDQLQEESEVE